MATWLRLSACCLTGVSLAVSGCAGSGTTDLTSVKPAGAASGTGAFLSKLWKPAAPQPPEPLIDTSDKLRNPERLHLAYADWQRDLGRLGEARKSYERVLEINPRSVEALTGLAMLDQAAGRSQVAEQRLQKAAQLSPGDASVMNALGEFYSRENRSREAIAAWQSAVALAPNQPVYEHNLAKALVSSGDFASAVPLLARSVGEGEAYYRVGHILYEQGRRDVAERYFAQALAKQPDLIAAHNMLAALRNDAAVPDAAPAISPSPRPALPAPAAQPKVASNKPVGPTAPTRSPVPNTKGPETFVIPVQYEVEPPQQVAGWAPTQDRPADSPSAATEMTPQQREQLANQSR